MPWRFAAMNKTDVIRAWKDPVYRATLTPEQIASLPEHPAGAIELADEKVRYVYGAVPTIATMYSYRDWRQCCP
jgi:mersacidin/lichenicidin family type 2 lantibiotic